MKLAPFGIYEALSSQRNWAPRFLLINSLELFRENETVKDCVDTGITCIVGCWVVITQGYDIVRQNEL